MVGVTTESGGVTTIITGTTNTTSSDPEADAEVRVYVRLTYLNRNVP